MHEETSNVDTILANGVSRRVFLRRGAKILAALGLGSGMLVLPGCGSSSGDNALSPASSGAAATAAPSSPSYNALVNLANRMQGPVVLPADPRYPADSTPQNLEYANIHPIAVAICLNAADVGQAVLWTRQYGVPFAARSGGHSYAGYSTTPGLLINLSQLNSMTLDTTALTLTIGPGALNRDVLNQVLTKGYAIPSGRCPTVAIGGLALGGGFGFASRMFGTVSDTMLETDVVTADGSLLTASGSSNSDLFFACRGGGGGNFGINTSFTFRVAPVGDVAYYQLTWNFSQAATVLATLQSIVASAPSAFSCRAGLGGSAPFPRSASDGLIVNALGQYFGPQNELVAILQPLLSAAPPATASINYGPYAAASSFLAATTPYDFYAVKSAYSEDVLSTAAIDTMIAFMQQWPGSSNVDGGGVAMFLWGGAIDNTPRTATAFVHRNLTWLVALDTSWTGTDVGPASKANMAWLQSFYNHLRPFLSTEAYQNFIDPDLADWPTAYYAENLATLEQIKRKYDPDNIFRFSQSIPPA